MTMNKMRMMMMTMTMTTTTTLTMTTHDDDENENKNKHNNDNYRILDYEDRSINSDYNEGCVEYASLSTIPTTLYVLWQEWRKAVIG
jgi:hypothetical protein